MKVTRRSPVGPPKINICPSDSTLGTSPTVDSRKWHGTWNITLSFRTQHCRLRKVTRASDRGSSQKSTCYQETQHLEGTQHHSFERNTEKELNTINSWKWHGVHPWVLPKINMLPGNSTPWRNATRSLRTQHWAGTQHYRRMKVTHRSARGSSRNQQGLMEHNTIIQNATL